MCRLIRIIVRSFGGFFIAVPNDAYGVNDDEFFNVYV